MGNLTDNLVHWLQIEVFHFSKYVRTSEYHQAFVRIYYAESDDTVIAFINGDESTCKKLKKLAYGIMLIPDNSQYEPMYFSSSDILDLPVRILGKVVGLRRTF